MPRDPEKKYDSVKRASANRLNLLSNMTGECFCTLDGDDYYCDTDFLSDAIDVFEKHDNVSVVAFGYKYVQDDIDGENKMLPSTYNKSCIDKSEYLRKYYIHSGACVHRKMWDDDRMLFLNKIGYYDDNDIVINGLNYGELFYINKVVYAYRQTGNSIYTSMHSLEQAVLNVQGYDVDKKFISEKYSDELIERNAWNIIRMYVWRKKLKSILGNDKFEKYYKSCCEIEDSLAYGIMAYDKVKKSKKKEIRVLMNQLMRGKKKTILKMYLRMYITR